MSHNPQKPQRIALIGCGQMGSALLKCWLNKDLPHTFVAIDPAAKDKKLDCDIFPSIKSANLKKYDIVIIAVKPQIFSAIMDEIQTLLSPQTLIISIAAGIKLKNISENPAIRIMPNTPAMIGKGISAGIANKTTTQEQKEVTQNLFKATGDFLWIENEDQMDDVTALSGSGPAYLFYIIEALAKAATQSLDLTPQQAIKLARQTIIGAAALAESTDNTSAQTLRENVTSPGGTTEAGLKILMNGKLDDLLLKTLEAAKNRSIELSGS